MKKKSLRGDPSTPQTPLGMTERFAEILRLRKLAQDDGALRGDPSTPQTPLGMMERFAEILRLRRLRSG